jgi:hypothetical protein
MPLCVAAVTFISLTRSCLLSFTVCALFIVLRETLIIRGKKGKQGEAYVLDGDSQCQGISGSILPN